MAGNIVGREIELEAVRRFLGASIDDPRALVLEGEAGIGKSTLWLEGVAWAGDRGLRVLSSRPAEAERDLAFAGLGDLFEEVLEEILPSLPRPRRHALEVALLVEEGAVSADPRALGVAVRNALEILAETGPLMLAVDDVQWLDPSSAGALSFALRRTQVPVRLLLARRLAESSEPSELERALAPASLAQLRVGPLSAGALQKLLHDRLDQALPRTMLLRIHETSGGNPFYALELARALSADADSTQPLPIPETLEGLVEARLAGLPRRTQEALAYVSALGHASNEVLRSVGVGGAALDPALGAQVIERTRSTIRFTHPLLASAVYQGLTVEERARIHGLLAPLVRDPLEQARHLALSTDEPDAAIASVLEQAADLATDRCAMAAAVELREHALRLTPLDLEADLLRRTLSAARAHLAVADVARARALSEALLERVPSGLLRAQALVLASDVTLGGPEAVRLRREALLEAEDDPTLQATIHQWLGWTLRFSEGPHAAEQHAWTSLELAEKLDDAALRAGGLATVSAARFHLAEPDAVQLGEDGYELACKADDPELLMDVTLAFASTLIWTTRLERAQNLLDALYEEWSERSEGVATQILWRLAFVDLARGHLSRAADHAGRAREISLQYGLGGAEHVSTAWAVALIDANRGELDRARELAEYGLGFAVGTDQWFVAYLEGVLGLVELWGGDARRAVKHFSAAEDARRKVGSLEPNLARWRAEYVEALLELGRIDEAVSVLDPWEAEGRRLDRAAVLAQTARCRGLVAAARGNVAEAVSLFEDAVVRHEAIGDQIGRARALLSLGVVRRRARQKRAAREAIEGAVRIFEECGAEGWAEKARAELGTIGGRRREPGLTPSEQRVAALVAEGRTNREVAAALFLGERTVETHLTHIYAKLGIRSRTELAHALTSDS